MGSHLPTLHGAALTAALSLATSLAWAADAPQAAGEGAEASTQGAAADAAPAEGAATPEHFPRFGVGVSLGLNGTGPTIAFRPIYDGTVSVTIVPVITPSVTVFNGGVKYAHVIARKRQAALYADASLGYYFWGELMKMVSPELGIGVHLTKPYWNYAEICMELNLASILFVGESSTSDLGNIPIIPVPAAGVSWWF